MDVLDDYGHPTQTMGRFRKPRRRRGFVEMRIGLLATLRDEELSLPRFFRLLENIEADSRVISSFVVFTRTIPATILPSFWPHGYVGARGYCRANVLGAPRLHGREIARTNRMAEARNQALAAFLMNV